MKSFSELKVTYVPADGKKHFKGVSRQLRTIVNIPLIIYDFERDVKTVNGERYVVSFAEERSPETLYKFFTNSSELKSYLELIEEMGEFPFTTKIEMETFDHNKTKYTFS